MLFPFCDFRGRENNQINEAQVQEVFFGLRGEIEALSLAQYFCELAEVVAPEGTESEEYLRLLLNALYFLSRKARPRLLLKAITEMRLLSLSGYMPDLVGCRRCGTYESPRMAFLPRSGQICCERCFHTPEEGKEPAVWLPPGAMMGAAAYDLCRISKTICVYPAARGTKAALKSRGTVYVPGDAAVV